jgi:hypothetical protein
MILAFSHTLDFPYETALALAKEKFPDLDYSNVNTSRDLDTLLLEAGEILYVDIDFDKQSREAIALENETAKIVEAQIGVLECPEDGVPLVYTQEELDAAISCEVPNEFPDPNSDDPDAAPSDKDLLELNAEISQLEKELDQILELQDEDKNKMLDCVGKMQSIADELNVLIDRETKVRETEINLEELYYNFSIFERYYKKRVQRLDEILGIFDPLIIEKRRLEAEIDRFQPIRDDDRDKFIELDKIINPQNYTSNVSGIANAIGNATANAVSSVAGAVSTAAGDAGLSGIAGAAQNASNATYTPQYSQQQYSDWQAAKKLFEDDEAYLNQLKADLQTTKDNLTMEQNKIAPFLNTDVTTVNTQQYGSNAEYERFRFLEQRLAGLFSGAGDSIYTRITTFTTRTTAVQQQNSNNSNTNESFRLEIKYTPIDRANILAGRPKTYMFSDQDTTILPVPPNETPHGILYDRLYNIWDDDEKFFTREERGLTANAADAASNLKGSGAEVFKGSFIGDVSKFRAFYENFTQEWENKVSFTKENVINPAHADLISALELFAVSEVEYLLAYGNAYEQLPADVQWLGNIIEYVRQSSERYMAKTQELRSDFLFVQESHKKVIADITTKRGQYLTVPCALNTAPPEQTEPDGAGSDPLGAESLLSMDPSKPNPTKWCYWVRFAAYATAVNILPLPGSGGFRYWPIGLTIPNPSGLIKIPLPIIWIPIAVIPLQVGIFVIFIGLCGICPSPVVFYIGPNGEKKFIISLRPGDDFGANAEESIIKTIDKLGVGIKAPIKNLINQIQVPGFQPLLNPDGSSGLLEDIKDKIIKNIQKLPQLPSTARLNALDPNASIDQKRAELKNAILAEIDKIKIPDLKFPKDGSTVNPKPPPITEIIDQLKKAAKLNLPQLMVPSVEKMNLKTKLLAEIDKLGLEDVELPSIPRLPEVPNELNDYLKKVREALVKFIGKAKSKITPEGLGILAEIGIEGVVFVNPYQCKGTTKGLSLPPIPGPVLIGLAVLDQLTLAAVNGISTENMLKLLGNRPALPGNLKELARNVLGTMPNVEVPNPSKVSIKDMLKDSVKMVVKMQLPSLPDPTKPPQIRISVPGELLRGSLKVGVEGIMNAFPAQTVPFPTLSPIDLKQIMVSIVEDSFKPVEDKLGPFLDIAQGFQNAKDKSFAELLGLKKLNLDHSRIPTVTPEAMAAAMAVVKTISLTPYPAVAIAPQLFKQLHPVLTSDDLPPWERFTLDNFLFVCFLDEWCRQGKKTCGFFENP